MGKDRSFFGNRRMFRVIEWVSALGACALLTGGVALGDVIATCGMIATTDVSLAGDLICTGTAITVGADAIVINLKSHTLQAGGGGYAVYNGGFDYVTVKYGTILGGEVTLENRAEYNTLADLKLLGTNIRLHDSDRGFIYRNEIHNGGILFGGSNESSENLVMSNVIECGEIEIEGNDNTIQGNTINACAGGHGIHNDEGHGTALIGNRVKNGGIFFDDAGHGAVLMDNKVTDSAQEGIFVRCGEATPLAPARIVRNQVSTSGGNGIDLDVSCGPTNTMVVANYASHNGGYGIYAPGYPADGGRNRAKDNAGPQQCLGVTCLP